MNTREQERSIVARAFRAYNAEHEIKMRRATMISANLVDRVITTTHARYESLTHILSQIVISESTSIVVDACASLEIESESFVAQIISAEALSDVTGADLDYAFITYVFAIDDELRESPIYEMTFSHSHITADVIDDTLALLARANV